MCFSLVITVVENHTEKLSLTLTYFILTTNPTSFICQIPKPINFISLRKLMRPGFPQMCIWSPPFFIMFPMILPPSKQGYVMGLFWSYAHVDLLDSVQIYDLPRLLLPISEMYEFCLAFPLNSASHDRATIQF